MSWQGPGRAAFLLIVLALAVTAGIWLATRGEPSLELAPAPHRDGTPSDGIVASHPAPTLSGTHALAERPAASEADLESPGAGWIVELVPPPLSPPESVAVVFRVEGASWEAAEPMQIAMEGRPQVELALPLDEWPTRPVELGLEAPGHPILILPIEWEPLPSARGSVRWEDGQGFTGWVTDGLGAPVAGVKLVFAEAFKFPGLWSAPRRVSAVADGRTLAVARSDAHGRFRVSRWPGELVCVASADPAWRVLREAGDQISRLASDGAPREVRVAVGRVALALLHVVGPPPEQSAWIEPVRLAPVDRIWPGPFEQPRGFLFGELEIPLGSGVHVCSRAVLLDGSLAFVGRPAGDVAVRAPGCLEQIVSLVWSTPHEPSVARCTLQPALAGSATRLAVELTEAIVGFSDEAIARASVGDLDSGEAYVMSFALAGGGRRLQSLVALPRGRYRIQCPLLSENVVVENGGERVSVKPAALHVVDISSNAGAKISSVTFATARFSAEPLQSITGDGCFGLSFALSERAVGRARFAFPLLEDDVHVRAAGPGSGPTTATVSLRSAGVTVLRVGAREAVSDPPLPR